MGPGGYRALVGLSYAELCYGKPPIQAPGIPDALWAEVFEERLQAYRRHLFESGDAAPGPYTQDEATGLWVGKEPGPIYLMGCRVLKRTVTTPGKPTKQGAKAHAKEIMEYQLPIRDYVHVFKIAEGKLRELILL